MLKNVRISNTFQSWPIFKQTPGGEGIWRNYRFFIDDRDVRSVCWVVIDDLPAVQQGWCARENTVLIIAEPPTVPRAYSAEFLAQFHTVIHCGGYQLDHPNTIQTQPALPWWLGVRRRPGLGAAPEPARLDYDSFQARLPEAKERVLSVICSDKAITEGHRQRLRFVERLQAHFGSRLDVFGFGRAPLEDKWDAIVPYRYHIALENGAFPDYWTEKLADAYLGGAYPLYHGCPNLEDYFPRDSFATLSLQEVERAIDTIERAIAEDWFGRFAASREVARTAVLERYNLFAVLSRLCDTMELSRPAEHLVMRPSASFVTLRGGPKRWGKTWWKSLLGYQ